MRELFITLQREISVMGCIGKGRIGNLEGQQGRFSFFISQTRKTKITKLGRCEILKKRKGSGVLGEVETMGSSLSSMAHLNGC